MMYKQSTSGLGYVIFLSSAAAIGGSLFGYDTDVNTGNRIEGLLAIRV